MSFKHEKLPCRILEGNRIYTAVRCIDMHSIFAVHMHGTKNCQKWIWHSFVFVTTPIDSFVQELALPKACHDTKVYGWKRRRMELDWWLISTASLCLSCLCVCVCLCDCSMLDSFVAAFLFPASHQREGWRHGGAEVPLRKCQRWRRRFTSIWLLDDMMICWMIPSRCHTHFAKWQSKGHKYWQKPAVSCSHGGHLCQNLVTQSPILCFFPHLSGEGC